MNRFFPSHHPQEVVSPTTLEEVQTIVKKANQDHFPLVAVSSGTNLQDTHLPSVPGATALDLSKMNRIIHFDARNRNAVIEPGVTFHQLEQVAETQGLKTLTAIDVPREASVLATYLEMMPLYGWPKYHPWEMLTMKGVRADGELFATGQMAMTQNRPDKYSWGVSFAQVARLFCQAQGTLGIITTAAVTLKTATPYNEVLFLPCPTINRTLKALKAIMATEESHELFAANNVYLAEVLGDVPPAELPTWTVVLVLRGFEEEEIAYKKKDISALARALGSTLSPRLKSTRGAQEKILKEISSPTGFSLHQKGDVGWVPLITIATANQILASLPALPQPCGVILLPLQAGGCFYFQPDLRYHPGEEKKTRDRYLTLCNLFLQKGIMFPRPSVLIASRVVKGHPTYYNLLRSIKQAIDPNYIMNPGKLGL